MLTLFKYFKIGYLLLIIIEVQYCNVFWDTYTQIILGVYDRSLGECVGYVC